MHSTLWEKIRAGAAQAYVPPELLCDACGRGKLLMHRSPNRQKFKARGVNCSETQILEQKESANNQPRASEVWATAM